VALGLFSGDTGIHVSSMCGYVSKATVTPKSECQEGNFTFSMPWSFFAFRSPSTCSLGAYQRKPAPIMAVGSQADLR
jgi:hypothetical protein